MGFLVIPFSAQEHEQNLKTIFNADHQSLSVTQAEKEWIGFRKNYLYLVSIIMQVVLTVFFLTVGIYGPGIVLAAISIIQIRSYRQIKATFLSNYGRQKEILDQIFRLTAQYLETRWKEKTSYLIASFNRASPSKQPHPGDNAHALKEMGDAYDAQQKQFFERAAIIFRKFRDRKTLPDYLLDAFRKVGYGKDTQNIADAQVDKYMDRNKGYVCIKIEDSHPVAHC